MFKNVKFGGIAKILVVLTIIVVGSIKINLINFKSYSDMLSGDTLDEARTEAPESIKSPDKVKNPTPSLNPDLSPAPSPAGTSAIVPSETFTAPPPQPTTQITPTPSPTPDIISSDEVVVEAGEAFIDASAANQGYIYCAFNSSKYSLLMIGYENTTEYCDIKHDGTLERISLTGGAGNYRIVIYENISGNSFRTVEAEEFNVNIENILMPYMVPTTMVYYDNSMGCIQLASQIADSTSGDEEIARKIYEWVVENVVYDFDIYGTLKAGYIPDAEYTYINKKGICYDFAVLYAAMCRSQQIPCRVAHGYSDNVSGFHAWNEVYFDGEYHIVDTSTDSQIDKMPFIRYEGYYPEKYS